MKQTTLIEVPGYGEVSVPFQLIIHRPGPFSDQPAIYLEDSEGLRAVRLTVCGEAIAPPSPDG